MEVYHGDGTKKAWNYWEWLPLGLNTMAAEGALRYVIWNCLRSTFKNAPYDIDEFGKMCLHILNEAGDKLTAPEIKVTETYQHVAWNNEYKVKYSCKFLNKPIFVVIFTVTPHGKFEKHTITKEYIY